MENFSTPIASRFCRRRIDASIMSSCHQFKKNFYHKSSKISCKMCHILQLTVSLSATAFVFALDSLSVSVFLFLASFEIVSPVLSEAERFLDVVLVVSSLLILFGSGFCSKTI